MLTSLFAPRGIAVIGASRDRTKLGYGVARNLVASNYPGAIHFINPKADRILGQPLLPVDRSCARSDRSRRRDRARAAGAADDRGLRAARHTLGDHRVRRFS